MTTRNILLIILGIPKPYFVHSLRKWIEEVQENVKIGTDPVVRVEFCYLSRQNDHFALLPLFNKDQDNQYP